MTVQEVYSVQLLLKDKEGDTKVRLAIPAITGRFKVLLKCYFNARFYFQ